MKPPETVWVRIFSSGYKQVTTNKQPRVSTDQGYEDFQYELKEALPSEAFLINTQEKVTHVN